MYESDNTNVNPSHYKQGGMESIDVIKAFTADLNGVDAFCAGNAIKYILRFSHKNGIEDIEKAIWYLTYLKDHYKPEQQPKIFATFDHIPDAKEIEKELMNSRFGILGAPMVGFKAFDPNAIVVAPPPIFDKPTESEHVGDLNTDGVHRDLSERKRKKE